MASEVKFYKVFERLVRFFYAAGIIQYSHHISTLKKGVICLKLRNFILERNIFCFCGIPKHIYTRISRIFLLGLYGSFHINGSAVQTQRAREQSSFFACRTLMRVYGSLPSIALAGPKNS